jgi:hypothetical protein
MLKSVQLSLMIGPVQPQTPPRMVMDTLSNVEVTLNDVGVSAFQLVFSFPKGSPMSYQFILQGGAHVLFMRVVLVATVNGVPNVLMDGVITNNHVAPGEKGSNSTLTITGEDLTALMNQSNQSGTSFAAMAASDRVSAILKNYSMYGISPQVIPTVMVDQSAPTDQVPSQKGTDLAYIQELAKQVGYVFYIQPGPAPCTSKAYWGPQVKVGPIQPVLSVDMDAYTNVESLHFNFDQQQKKTPTVINYNDDTNSAQNQPVPSYTLINPSLGSISLQPANTMGDTQPAQDDWSKKPVPQSSMAGMATASQAAESVSGEGTLDVTRYGQVLNARQLVAVRGAGAAFDGLYYVKSVTHKIKRGEYKQDFKLSRDGLGSTIPAVAS